MVLLIYILYLSVSNSCYLFFLNLKPPQLMKFTIMFLPFMKEIF